MFPTVIFLALILTTLALAAQNRPALRATSRGGRAARR